MRRVGERKLDHDGVVYSLDGITEQKNRVAADIRGRFTRRTCGTADLIITPQTAGAWQGPEFSSWASRYNKPKEFGDIEKQTPIGYGGVPYPVHGDNPPCGTGKNTSHCQDVHWDSIVP